MLRRPPLSFDAKTTLIDILEARAIKEPDKVCYQFFDRHGNKEASLTYRDLADRVFQAARCIADRIGPGDRVVIVFPPGIDYIVSFFATIAAGGIAVPCYPPFAPNLAQQFNNIVEDCHPEIIFTNEMILGSLKKLSLVSTFRNIPIVKYLVAGAAEAYDSQVMQHFSSTHVLTIEEAVKSDSDADLPSISPDSIAFLQYTSGSTGKPKGVVLKHSNIIENLIQIGEMMIPRENMHVISWLPPYHDMGLIGGVIAPLFHAMSVSLLSPASFLQRPLLWLKLISEQKAGVSGGPNFAYDLCVRKITTDELQGLDLSSWEVAFNGADYIHPETMMKFSEKFKETGFQHTSFYPCYGMAEATLFITGKSYNSELGKEVKVTDLQQNGDGKAIRRVSCGIPHPEIKVFVVDPENGTLCANGEQGEVWIQGKNMADGYFNKPDLTTEVFHAHIQGLDEGPFMRTGDLGCVVNGELYITGRLKDLIVFQGRNYAPHDLETCYQDIDPNIRKGCGVIIQVPSENGEKIVVVQEVKTKENLEAIASGIYRRILEEYALPVSEVLLVEPKSVPKTTSGKLKRRQVLKLYTEKLIQPLHAASYVS